MRVATLLLLGLMGCVKQPEGPRASVAPRPHDDPSTSGEADVRAAEVQAAPKPEGNTCPLGAITASLSHERTRSGAAFVFVAVDDDQLTALRERVTRMADAYGDGESSLDRIHDGIRLVVRPRRPQDAPAVRRDVRAKAESLLSRCPSLRPLTEPRRVATSWPSTDESPEPLDLPDFDDDIEPDEPEDPEPGPNEPEPDEPEDPEPGPNEPEPDEPEDPEPGPIEPEPDEPEDPEPEPDEPEEPEDPEDEPDEPYDAPESR